MLRRCITYLLNSTLQFCLFLSFLYSFLFWSDNKTSLPKVIWEEGRVLALSHTYAVRSPLVIMACPKFAPKVPLPVDRSPNSTVCLSVTRVLCDKVKQWTADFLIPHERAISLVFWHQQWSVGHAPFRLKFALKVCSEHLTATVADMNDYITTVLWIVVIKVSHKIILRQLSNNAQRRAVSPQQLSVLWE